MRQHGSLNLNLAECSLSLYTYKHYALLIAKTTDTMGTTDTT